MKTEGFFWPDTVMWLSAIICTGVFPSAPNWRGFIAEADEVAWRQFGPRVAAARGGILQGEAADLSLWLHREKKKTLTASSVHSALRSLIARLGHIFSTSQDVFRHHQ